jgi:hypothetical protein
MNAFDTTLLSRLQSTQEVAMQDTGYLQTYSRTFNSFGEQVDTWTESVTATACGLDMRTGAERHGTENTLVEYDATVRLPISATPDIKDRIRITKRFGVSLGTALTFEIEGPIQRGPSGIRLLLKRVLT